MYQKRSTPSAQLHPETLPERLLAKCLLVFVAAYLVATPLASVAVPLGATLHSDGTTTFRVWAPFVDDVAVKINGGMVVPLTQEPGHTDPADTTWVGTVPGTKAVDQYRYVIRLGGVTREFNDPRAQQLTGFDLPDGFGLPGNDSKPKSVLVDPNFSMPAFTEPTFNTMVIYEMHVGTFSNTFTGAVQKLDYPKNLGINAVEVLPITQNPLFSDHTPADHDWGYDPVQLFAVRSKYGTPQEFKEFVKQGHAMVKQPTGKKRGGGDSFCVALPRPTAEEEVRVQRRVPQSGVFALFRVSRLSQNP
jgi:1,4-alpha-glucan branching enzyme